MGGWGAVGGEGGLARANRDVLYDATISGVQ